MAAELLTHESNVNDVIDFKRTLRRILRKCCAKTRKLSMTRSGTRPKRMVTAVAAHCHYLLIILTCNQSRRKQLGFYASYHFHKSEMHGASQKEIDYRHLCLMVLYTGEILDAQIACTNAPLPKHHKMLKGFIRWHPLGTKNDRTHMLELALLESTSDANSRMRHKTASSSDLDDRNISYCICSVELISAKPTVSLKIFCVFFSSALSCFSSSLLSFERLLLLPNGESRRTTDVT